MFTKPGRKLAVGSLQTLGRTITEVGSRVEGRAVGSLQTLGRTIPVPV